VANVSTDEFTVRVMKSAAALWFAGTFATSTVAFLAHRVYSSANILARTVSVGTSAANRVRHAR
jgi:hypothetical protein